MLYTEAQTRKPTYFFSGGKKVSYIRESPLRTFRSNIKRKGGEEEEGGTICIWMAGDDGGGGITFTLTELFLIFPPRSMREKKLFCASTTEGGELPLLLCQTVPRRRI